MLALDIGKISTDAERIIHWFIPNYLQLVKEANFHFCSPYFDFYGDQACLCVYPKRDMSGHGDYWMGMGCGLYSFPEGCTILCGIVDSKGQETRHITLVADDVGETHNYYTWLRPAEIESQKDKMLPDGQLHIVCRILVPTDGDKSRVIENSCLHELSQNLSDLYIESKNWDLLIRVGGREFKAHRLILMSRVPAFEAMLTHNMVENNTGVIHIEDCDPDVFNDFLMYIYCGKVKEFSHKNVSGLYVLADKYGLQLLKEMSVEFMSKSLNIDTICEVISLAATYIEAELLETGLNFFAENSEKILATDNYLLFLKENPTQAKELFIKAHYNGKKASK